jgi:hypothetical protein
MLNPLRSVKKLIRSWVDPQKQKTFLCKPAGVHLRLEALEDRLAPATLSDAGTAILAIVLKANENLAIVSNGTSYTFTSNQAFTATSGANPANQGTAFGGLGTKTLVLTNTGLLQYGAAIKITDSGANATVTFNDSGTNAYANNFTVGLTNAGTIDFNGTSNFGAFNLLAVTTRNIFLNRNGVTHSVLQSGSGNLTLLANVQATPTSGDFNGINVDNTTVSSTSGAITLMGRGGDSSSGQQEGVHILYSVVGAGTSGTVTVDGTGGAALGDRNFGISGSVATVTSGGGDVRVIGHGGGSGASGFNYGVQISITAGGTGRVLVDGTGGATTGAQNVGVMVRFVSISSHGGDVRVTGHGGGSGASGFNYGVVVNDAITASGTGAVFVDGTGGPTSGSTNIGVVCSGLISSNGGDVKVTGHGGGSGASGQNVGVDVSGTVTAPATAKLTLQGTGGLGSGGKNLGVHIGTGSAGTVQAANGDISITGIEGTGPTDFAFVTESAGSAVKSTGMGNITINANSMVIGSSTSIGAGVHILALLPNSAGVGFNLGTTTDTVGGPVGLSAAELQRVSAGTLQVGNAASGTITVSAAIALTAATYVNLTSGGDIVFNPGSLNTHGGALTLAPATTGAVKPLTAGIDANVTPAPLGLGFASGSNLTISVSGASLYNQLSVSGRVNLSGANLLLTGPYVPVIGNVFTVVSGTSVTGTFAGLADGALVPFNGKQLTVHYTATGVTLSVALPTTLVGLDASKNLVVSDIALGGKNDVLTLQSDTANSRFVISDPNYCSPPRSPVPVAPARTPSSFPSRP